MDVVAQSVATSPMTLSAAIEDVHLKRDDV